MRDEDGDADDFHEDACRSDSGNTGFRRPVLFDGRVYIRETEGEYVLLGGPSF